MSRHNVWLHRNNIEKHRLFCHTDRTDVYGRDFSTKCERFIKYWSRGRKPSACTLRSSLIEYSWAQHKINKPSPQALPPGAVKERSDNKLISLLKRALPQLGFILNTAVVQGHLRLLQWVIIKKKKLQMNFTAFLLMSYNHFGTVNTPGHDRKYGQCYSERLCWMGGKNNLG